MSETSWAWAVRAAAIVPLLAGGAGALSGLAFMGENISPAIDSHGRYLSGLLLGIGLATLWCAQAPRGRAEHFFIIAAIVTLGGCFRALGWVLVGPPPGPHQLALIMELGVVPLLALWLARLR